MHYDQNLVFVLIFNIMVLRHFFEFEIYFVENFYMVDIRKV